MTSYAYDARISEETAQEVLMAFGISERTPEYDRWVRDDGFRPVDLVDVLAPSKRLFAFDHRGDLQEFLVALGEALRSHGIESTIGATRYGNNRTHAAISIDRETVNFELNQGELIALEDKLSKIEVASSRSLRFWISGDGTDTVGLAILGQETWKNLEALDATLIEYLFGKPITRARPMSWLRFFAQGAK